MSSRGEPLASETHECKQPPCIHVIIDPRKRIFKIFVEDYNVIAPISLEAVREACSKLRRLAELIEQGYREARGDEVDFLARKYLEAVPVKEKVVERE